MTSRLILICIISALVVAICGAEPDIMRYAENLMPENNCPENSLIVSASGGMGLCNQIDMIAYGLEVARVTQRALCVHSFRTDYSRSHEVPVEEIIDINATNDKLRALPEELGFSNVRISGFFNRYDHATRNMENICLRSVNTRTAPVGPKKCKFSGSHYINVPVDGQGRNDLIAVLLEDNIKSHSKIHLSPGVPNVFDFFGHETATSQNRISHLYRAVTFAPFLQEAAKGLMEKMGIAEGNFTAIHMRLEDDFVLAIWNQHDVDSWRIDMKSFHFIMANDFVSHLLRHISVKERVFIVTGLTLMKHTLNFMPYMMETLFRESDYHFQDKLYMPLPNNRRELHAIVDAIVATKASSFIGFDPVASTFSKYVSRCLPEATPVALMPVNYTKKATDLRPNCRPETYLRLSKLLPSNTYYDKLRKENLEGRQTVSSTDLML